MPTYLRIGAAYRMDLGDAHRLLMVLDLNRELSDTFTLHPGIEWSLRDRIAVRLGFNGRNDAGAGITTGVAWTHRDLGLSYAFVPFGSLGDSHRISLSYRWGEDRGNTRMSRVPKKIKKVRKMRKTRPRKTRRRKEKPSRPQFYDWPG